MILDTLLDFNLCLVSSPSPLSLVFKNGSFFASKVNRNAFEASSLALIAGNEEDSVLVIINMQRKILHATKLRNFAIAKFTTTFRSKNLEYEESVGYILLLMLSFEVVRLYYQSISHIPCQRPVHGFGKLITSHHKL